MKSLAKQNMVDKFENEEMNEKKERTKEWMNEFWYSSKMMFTNEGVT